MKAPDSFVDALKREFGDRLRIRWSLRRKEWHIEQQVGRSQALLPFRIEDEDDDLVRARDGYWFVMAITPSDRMDCPGCGLELKVPVRETAEVKCDYCRLRGRDGRYRAAFWPLNDSLLEHLRRIDPHRDGIQEMRDAADAANQMLLASKERAAVNEREAATKENWTRMVGIQSVGYTGKEKAWAA